MKEGLKEYLDSLNYSNVNDFIEGTDFNVKFIKESKKVSVDLSWIDIVEKAIPYLDTLIRNPRRFIAHEDDIVKTEKAKKITTETVKHLSQHTSYIQGLDEDGLIRPIKVLNSRKEETLDIYENRFIYTLVKNLNFFVKQQMKIEEYESFYSSVKNLEYKGKTKFNNEVINTVININSQKKEVFDIEKGKKRNHKERIMYINEVLNEFIKSPFMNEMTNATPLRSPIRRTNIMLKDNNFKVALGIWELLEKYETTTPVIVEENKVDDSKNINKYNINFSTYLNYDNISDTVMYGATSEEKVKNYIGVLVDELVFKNKITDAEFKRILFNEIKEAKNKRNKIYLSIKRIFDKYIQTEENKVNKTLNLLKK